MLSLLPRNMALLFVFLVFLLSRDASAFQFSTSPFCSLSLVFLFLSLLLILVFFIFPSLSDRSLSKDYIDMIKR